MGKKVKINDIFEYRNVWMGIATIWIVLSHAEIYWRNDVFAFFKSMGYGGVDIFLFASGVGCYFSLDKDSDAFLFLKRRVLRIMPTYWLFIAFWGIYKFIISEMTIRAVLGNFFCVQNVINSGYSFNWYMCAIWILYFLSPYFKGAIDRVKSLKGLLQLVVLLLIFTIPFFAVRHYIIIVTRFPIFVIGMYFAKLGKKDMELTKKSIVVLCGLTVAGIFLYRFCLLNLKEHMWNYGLYWYPFIFITPGLCVGSSLIFKRFQENVLKKILNEIGRNSFEVYLIHVIIFEIYDLLVSRGYIEASNWNMGIAIFCILPGCAILRLCVQMVTKVL